MGNKEEHGNNMKLGLVNLEAEVGDLEHEVGNLGEEGDSLKEEVGESSTYLASFKAIHESSQIH